MSCCENHACKTCKFDNRTYEVKNLKVRCNATVDGDLTVNGQIGKKYDYILVGFGTTANVIARKLLDANKSVLILERGHNNVTKTGIRFQEVFNPLAGAANFVDKTGAVVNTSPQLTTDLPWSVLYNPKINISSTGTQRFRSGYSAGNGWGGGGTHYYMNAYRGSDYVYNSYDAATGNTGKWSYNTLLPYLKAFEGYVQRPNNPGPINSDRGTNGPLSIVQMDDWTGVDGVLNDVTLQKFALAPSVGLGYSPDLNSSGVSVGPNYSGFFPVGVSFRQTANQLQLDNMGQPIFPTFGGAFRECTLYAFMNIGEVIDENGNGLNGYDVKVVSDAYVNKVLFKGKKAIGVEYVEDLQRFATTTTTVSTVAFPLVAGVVNVASTAGFPASGRILIDGFYNVTYTGVTATSFTGCNTFLNNKTTPATPQTGLVNAGALVSIGLYQPQIGDPIAGPITGGFIDLVLANTKKVYGKKIILSSGAHSDPLILQRSGVGPAALLNSFNIPVVVDNANVGSNLRSHYNVGVALGPTGASTSARLTTASATAWMGFNLHGLTDPGYIYPNDQVRRIQAALTSGAATPNNLSLATNMYQPKSFGWCNITGVSPLAVPDINLNLYSDAGSLVFPPAFDSDMNRGVAFLKVVKQIVQSSGTLTFTGSLLTAINAGTDLALVNWLKDNISVQFHSAGTCRIGTDVSDSVVDVDLKIHGTCNLYCASLSVLPYAPDGNPNESLSVVAVRLLQTLNIPVLPVP